MATIKLDESANGKAIHIAPNDIIEISLDETPTSGFRWELSNLDKHHFQLISEDYDLYEGAGMGGGGIKKIQLKALCQASGSVLLQNKQPWSGDVDKSFEFTYS